MTGLCGKGLWLTHSYDLPRAIEMATSAEATHLLIKVGHGPHYFPETARELAKRVRGLGFHPLAWQQLTDRAPHEAIVPIQKALALDYEAVILFVGTALLTGEQLKPLAAAIEAEKIPRERLILASPPVAYLPDRRVLQTLAPLCKGGWMPLCFAAWGAPEQVIDRDVYQTLGDLSLLWGGTPPVYPVLSPQGAPVGTTLLPETFIPWIEGITRHGIDFFSMHHVAITEKAFWPMLQAARVTCQERQAARAAAMPASTAAPQPVAATIAQPVYITVSAGDTIWGIMNRHGLTKTRFWEWNGHLWDSRGLPRDSDYLQEGWRLRVK